MTPEQSEQTPLERMLVDRKIAFDLLAQIRTTYPGLPPSASVRSLSQPGSRTAKVELSLLDRLLSETMRWSGHPALGLHIATAECLPLLPSFVESRSLAQVRTVSAELEALRRAAATLPIFDLTLSERGSLATVTLEQTLTPGLPALTRFWSEYLFGHVMRVLRRAQRRPGAAARRVCFRFAPPRFRAAHAAFFGSPVLFGQPSDALTFRRGLLDLPCTSARSGDEPQLSSGEQLLAPRVRALVAEHAPRPVDSEEAAQVLGLSQRMLRRRLASEGTTMSVLLDEERCRVACSELARGSSLEAIAERTGFADRSSFHRAFRRWTGLTPAQYLHRGLRWAHQDQLRAGSPGDELGAPH